MIPMIDEEIKIFNEFYSYPKDEKYPIIIDFVRQHHMYKEKQFICFLQQDTGSRTRCLVFMAKFDSDGHILYNLNSEMELPELIYLQLLEATQNAEEFTSDLVLNKEPNKFSNTPIPLSQAKIPIELVKDICRSILSELSDFPGEVTLIEAAPICNTNKYLLCLKWILSENTSYYLMNGVFDQAGRMRMVESDHITLSEHEFNRFITMIKHFNTMGIGIPNFFNRPEKIKHTVDTFYTLFVSNHENVTK